MKRIDGKRLREFMETKNIQIVDVGSERDYRENHIMGAANIPITRQDFVNQVEEKFKRKNQSIVLCSNVETSKDLEPISRRLEEAGYDSVFQYSAEPKDWRNASLRVQS